MKRKLIRPKPPIGGFLLWEIIVHFCYIDESGNSETITKFDDNVQPMLVILGAFVDGSRIIDITNEFIALKRRFYPKQFPIGQQKLDTLLAELKGSDIRADFRKNSKSSKIVQHHFRFLDAVIALLKNFDIKITARIWIKGFNRPLDDKPVYTKTTQQIASRFQCFLENKKSHGIMVMDYRDTTRNGWVSNSVFTQQIKFAGNEYPLITEIPTFGVSNHHAVLQICDIICSTILYPIAGIKLCSGKVSNVHTHPNYRWLVERYSKRLKSLQFHCVFNGQQYWGITADNQLEPNKRNLFY
jgi:hypothetical protein